MKWITQEQLDAEDLQVNPAIHPMLMQLLYNRGIKNQQDVSAFLYSLEFADPFLIPDMKKCVARILQAKEKQQKVVIHGDYDVDGVSSSAMMYLYLKNIVGIKNITVYIPHRLEEGYGLSKKTIDTFIAEGVDLLITVDCGIKDTQLVNDAMVEGLDVIISDHHTPPEVLPKAVAIIHPMFYAYHNLCGAGVVLKILQALDSTLQVSYAKDFVDLAGLGTVCDVMELVGENRVIVKHAITKLRNNERHGLEALFSISQLDKATIDTYHIGYIIGPKLNASGRLASAYDSLSLLTTSDPDEAKQMANQLVALNKKRQEVTQDAVAKALQEINPQEYINIVYIPNISVGIVGLIAGKLTEITNKPSIAFTDDSKEGILAASCRSIDDFPIVDALDMFADMLVSYGGHKKAAGLKLQKKDYQLFKTKLQLYAKEALETKRIEKILHIDMPLSLLNVDLAVLFQVIHMLEPFGESNPRPVFSSRVRIKQSVLMGENGKHIRLHVQDEQGTYSLPIEAVGFNMGDRKIGVGEMHDIAYNIQRNYWNGKERFQLNLIDIL